jgi:hypothetical protein
MDVSVMYTQCSSSSSVAQEGIHATLLAQFQIETALQLAMSEINNKSDLKYDSILPDTVLQPHYIALNASDSYIETLRLSEVLPAGLSAAIGPDNGSPLWGMVPYYAENDIFAMGYSLVNDMGALLPSYVQSNPAREYEGELLAAVAAHFQFHKVVVFYSSTYSENYLAFLNLKNHVDQFNIAIVKEIDINGLSSDSLDHHIEACGQYNVYIFLMYYFEAVPLFETLHGASFFRQNMQLLGSSHLMAPDMWSAAATTLSPQEIASIMTGYIGIESQCIPVDTTDFSSRFYNFQHQLLKETQTSPNLCFGQFENVSGIDVSAVHAYNAVIAVAMGLHTVVMGPQTCQGVDISPGHDLFSILNATSNGEMQMNAALLKQVIETCTPFSGASDVVIQDDTATNVTFSIVNFDSSKYEVEASVMQTQTQTQTSSLFCPDSALPGMRVVGAVDAAALRFFTCRDYSSSSSSGGGGNLSESCSEEILFNTEDNSVPMDHTPEKYESFIDQYAVLLVAFLWLGVLLTLACGVIICNNRELRIVRISQPEFSYVIMVGIGLNYLSGVIIVMYSSQCFLLQWVASLSFTFTVAPLLVSVWRMHMVLSRGLNRSKVTVADGMKCIASIVAVKVILLSCYTTYGFAVGETMMEERTDPSVGEYEYCNLQFRADRDPFFSLFWFLNAAYDWVFFVAGVYYALSTRTTPIAEHLARRTLSGNVKMSR